jgi:multiple sugar transport system ATP-binding protein
MATLTLDRLSKRYAGAHEVAVHDVSFTVADGEFMVLLGPSGCGKSTTLRMVAGLESITSGTLAIDGVAMNNVPAKDRDIAMVFQSYALYPHMTVYDNLAFGLRRRSMPGDEIARRVKDAATMLGLDPLLERKPHALSGGQRQRVALGRAIVRDPKVFLFDEPLSNLDAALRVGMRGELSALHRRLSATMLYVTHDQVEAMTMGDRICIMQGGNVAQIGAPLEVYAAPANTFVAAFLGSPAMNLMPATLGKDNDVLHVGTQALALSGTLRAAAARSPSRAVLFGIRPEDLHPGAGAASLQARVLDVEPLGAETIVRLLPDGISTEVLMRVPRTFAGGADEIATVAIDLDASHLFDTTTTRRI